MSMERHIERLQKEQAKAQCEIDTIAELRREFPDLEIDKDRWGRVRYMAKSANPRVNEVLFHRNCGCCADSPLHARPYLKLVNGIEIYSNPCNVMIGSPSEWGSGFREYDRWRETYEEAGINPAIIERIEQHLAYLSTEEEDDDD